eukprot:TRINITY_DN3789_c0_g1_i13.p2 TRINITY_DN3789_c0_g1~~TRINITY_DN3789_c0_g1_i13.p2  ORF type:complete len:140 (+),score=30.00 TRINITY_DN3789_c0_g1_i13:671-1090(+)
MTPQAFHDRCDGKANTFTFVRDKNNNVFGGFTCVPWSGRGGHTTDKCAFLFNLTQGKVQRVTQASNAVYMSHNSGPTFGGDLWCDDDDYDDYDDHDNLDLDLDLDVLGGSARPCSFGQIVSFGSFTAVEVEVWGTNATQ